MYRHGQFTKEALEERALLRALLERSREPLLTRAQLNGSFLGPRLVTAKDVAMVLLAHGFEIPPSPPKVVARQGLQDDFDFQSINRSTMVTLPLRPRNNAAVT